MHMKICLHMNFRLQLNFCLHMNICIGLNFHLHMNFCLCTTEYLYTHEILYTTKCLSTKTISTVIPNHNLVILIFSRYENCKKYLYCTTGGGRLDNLFVDYAYDYGWSFGKVLAFRTKYLVCITFCIIFHLLHNSLTLNLILLTRLLPKS